jgi:hypothetical protein
MRRVASLSIPKGKHPVEAQVSTSACFAAAIRSVSNSFENAQKRKEDLGREERRENFGIFWSC